MRQEARDTGELAARALETDEALLALGNEVFEAAGATFVRNRSAPLIRDANHVRDIRASTPEEIELLLARVEEEFGGWCPHRRFNVDYRTPPEFAARLALEGYPRYDALWLALEGELKGSEKPYEIREVASEADWAAYAEMREMDWQAYVARLGRPYDDTEKEAMRQMLQVWRSKVPPVRTWMAYVDGVARAYCSSWGGAEGVGQVEDLFTHPDFRHRGLATALIHRCVAACRSEGAQSVVIGADPTDTPKQMYAAMGFRPLAIESGYWKRVEG